MKILIIKLSSFGDIIHTLPVLNILKEHKPHYEIHWLVSESFKDLLEENLNISKLHILRKDLKKWPETIQELKQERFDRIYDLQGLIKTGIIAKLCSIKFPLVRVVGGEVYGLSPARERLCELFWDKKIQSTPILDQEKHVIERNIEILKAENIDIHNIQVQAPFLKTPPLGDRGAIILAPETRWESKNWNYWKELIELLTKTSLKKDWGAIMILGSHPDNKYINFENIQDLRGKTSLKDLMNIVSQAKIVIGNDSGILHLASAYRIKTLGLFGATSPKRTGNWGGKYIYLNLDCAPCHKRTCKYKETEEYMQCMNQISASMIFDRIKALLD